MSAAPVTAADLRAMKAAGRQIAMLTAYDAPTAALVDESGADLILIGDSVALFALGRETTIGVTVEEMLHHTRAVSRSARRAMVISDMPFMSYEASARDAIVSAGRMLTEGGASGVKMPIDPGMIGRLADVAAANVPVLAHILPTTLAGTGLDNFERWGGTAESARTITAVAAAAEEAGAFAILLETVDPQLGAAITGERTVPVLSFGAGNGCDGQVSSTSHVLGLAPGETPDFIRRYVDLKTPAREALAAFRADVSALADEGGDGGDGGR